ncbi:DUF488 domain-containing protein [Faunimonas sp. B44]|uniref:DUF488 domain-containing protein n=1 Tax=Faunimonas sp. B44 TaxID=3461493 RepID=UPI004044F566
MKRVYLPPDPSDGRRILVDRLWPRGLAKAEAAIDEWAKEIAPSHELRRAFHGHSERWEEFRVRYRDELKDRGDELDALLASAGSERLTLLFAARDEERNNAVALKAILEARLAARD